MPQTNAERQAKYRLNNPEKYRARQRANKPKYKSRQRQRRKFTGCDGEGCGVDALGRQNYMLFRMGERELYTGAPLTTYELLDFICDHPSNEILVGFAFGYDVTMILRDLPAGQQRRLFEPKTFGAGHSPYVWYKDFDIDYLPKNYFKVKRVNVIRASDGSEKRVPVKGSLRTIYETFGFFQKSFLKVIKEFDVATPEELRRIQTNKNARSEFLTIDDEIRAYCALECRFLGELMTKLRTYCENAGIVPQTWSGAGKLAAALHKQHDTPKTVILQQIHDPSFYDAANMAYYGGRFEITRGGLIDAPVYEYDIRSAYPAAMRDLPCMVHGSFVRVSGSELRKHGLYVASLSFKGSPSTPDPYGQLGGFPVRSKEGHLYWPLQGAGVYWSPEIESAERLGFKVKLKEGWAYEKKCNCKIYDWVERLFNYRREIGSSGPGYPIKLGINSLYGKLAQRKGNGAFANIAHAGLITALTRAKLNNAIAASPDPSRILMLATDALYSLDPLQLDLGENLGQWERSDLAGLFVVQPGLYWDPSRRKRKSRGLSGRFFEEPGRTEAFEDAWGTFAAGEPQGLSVSFPAVSVPVPGFTGLKLAVSRGKPETAGTWTEDSRVISFDYRNKRSGHEWRGGHLVTKPKLGGPDVISLPHREFISSGGADAWDATRLELEDQREYVDLGPPQWDD